MNPNDLPDNLTAVERSLASRARPQASAALRGRVLAATRQELSASPAPRRLTTWEFAAAAAAAVLLGLNLAASVTDSTDLTGARRSFAPTNTVTAATVRSLAPYFTAEEAAQQATVLGAGSRLAMLPQLRPCFPARNGLRP